MERMRSKVCWYDRFGGGVNPITVADCVVFDAEPLVAHADGACEQDDFATPGHQFATPSPADSVWWWCLCDRNGP